MRRNNDTQPQQLQEKKKDKKDEKEKKPLSLYNDKDCKQLLVENLPDLLKNNAPDYAIFFSTFTFENNRLPDRHTDYTTFFLKLWSRINKKTVSSAKRKQQFVKLLLVPEQSKSKNGMNFTHRHYHGFLFVPHSQLEKFKRNCVEESKFDLATQKNKLTLSPSIVFPSESLAPVDSIRSEFLKIRSYAIYDISRCPSDFAATAIYSGKAFTASSYTSDDVLLFAKN